MSSHNVTWSFNLSVRSHFQRCTLYVNVLAISHVVLVSDWAPESLPRKSRYSRLVRSDLVTFVRRLWTLKLISGASCYCHCLCLLSIIVCLVNILISSNYPQAFRIKTFLGSHLDWVSLGWELIHACWVFDGSVSHVEYIKHILHYALSHPVVLSFPM